MTISVEAGQVGDQMMVIELIMFTLFTMHIEYNDMSAVAVARSLNSRGITGKRGGKWQGQSVKRTISHTFHENRADFPHPSQWGTMPWHRV